VTEDYQAAYSVIVEVYRRDYDEVYVKVGLVAG